MKSAKQSPAAASRGKMESDETLQCYELLSMQYLEQSQDDDIWQKLHDWRQGQMSMVQVIVSLPKELWFIAVLLRENPNRLKKFLAKHDRSLISEEEDLLVNYLQSFFLTELHLDTTFRSNANDNESIFQNSNGAMTQITQNLMFRPPLAIFR